MKENLSSKFFSPEQESKPKFNITTRTVVLTQDNYILLLEKSADSKNPGALEHPGGNIDDINILSHQNKNYLLTQEAKREIIEETSIPLNTQHNFQPIINPKNNSHDNYFEYTYSYKGQHRKTGVYCYVTRLPINHNELIQQIKINTQISNIGEAEDKHQSFELFSIEDYHKLFTNHDHNNKNFLANNSKIDPESIIKSLE